tara:strand:- start:524 stop:1258 length:735 start_codon:yes stop_codon:yes gene_type:complete
MNKQITRRDVLKGTAIASSGLMMACSTTPEYSTNTARLKGSSFGNHKFDAFTSIANLGKDGQRIFGSVEEAMEGYKVVAFDTKGNEIPSDSIFPYWSLRMDEIGARVSPKDQQLTWRRRDGLVRLFVRDENIQHLQSNRGYTMPSLPKKDRIITVPEPSFHVPMIDFESGKVEAPYAGFVDATGQRTLALVSDPEYFLMGGNVEYHGSVYTEKLGKVASVKLQQGVTDKNTVDAKAIRKPVPVK